MKPVRAAGPLSVFGGIEDLYSAKHTGMEGQIMAQAGIERARARGRLVCCRAAVLALAWLWVLTLPARAEGERAGQFDYYVLSLSWSPSWCALEGDARRSVQCRHGTGNGWILHGLWPQYERGWPSDCRGATRQPSRSETRAMADIMGEAGSAWYQWKKHGRCSGLDPADYFALARRAYASITRPKIFRKLPRIVALPARVVEQAFLKANPGLAPDGVTVTCKAGLVQEVRICLTRELNPRACGADVARDCTLRDAKMAPIR